MKNRLVSALSVGIIWFSIFYFSESIIGDWDFKIWSFFLGGAILLGIAIGCIYDEIENRDDKRK